MTEANVGRTDRKDTGMTEAEMKNQSNKKSFDELSEMEMYLSLVSDLDEEVADAEVSDEKVADTEVSDEEVPDVEVSDGEASGAEVSDRIVSYGEDSNPGMYTQEDFPTADQLERELKHEQYRRKYLRTLRGTLYTLITVSAVAVLIAMLFLPVLQIYGTSMTPTLYAGDTVISVKTASFETGDVIAFYLTSNRVLVKRVIASAGQWVDIDEDGNVYVDGELLDEPYVDELAYGECDIDLPYQVPDGQYFVMGDHRSTSVDSRSTSIGCVTEDQVVGKVVFRVWPFSSFGFIN